MCKLIAFHMVIFSIKYRRYSEFILYSKLKYIFQTGYTTYESYLVQIHLHLSTNENIALIVMMPDDMLHYVEIY